MSDIDISEASSDDTGDKKQNEPQQQLQNTENQLKESSNDINQSNIKNIKSENSGSKQSESKSSIQTHSNVKQVEQEKESNIFSEPPLVNQQQNKIPDYIKQNEQDTNLTYSNLNKSKHNLETIESDYEYYSDGEQHSEKGKVQKHIHTKEVPQREFDIQYKNKFVQLKQKQENQYIYKQHNQRRKLNTFLFNLFMKNQLKHLKQTSLSNQQYLSFIGQSNINYQYYQFLTSNQYLSRAVLSNCYYESSLQKRIIPYSTQICCFKVIIPIQVINDINSRFKQPVLQFQVCQLKLKDNELHVDKLSNCYQQSLNFDIKTKQLELKETIYVNADLVNNQSAFLLFELSGYTQNQVLCNYGWGAVSLVSGVNFMQTFQINNVINPISTILNNQSLADPIQPINQCSWNNLAKIYKDIHFQQMHKAFITKGLVNLLIYNKNILIKEEVSQSNFFISLQMQQLSTKNIQRLNRLPVNFICNSRTLRILDHSSAVFCNNSESMLVNNILSQQTILQKHKQTNKCGSNQNQIIINHTNLNKEQYALHIILNSVKYSMNQQLNYVDNYLSVCSMIFNEIYKIKEIKRKNEMRSSIKVNQIEDRVFLEDFIKFLTIFDNIYQQTPNNLEILQKLKQFYLLK